MAVPRQRSALTPDSTLSPSFLGLDVGVEWPDVVADDADLDRLAGRLYRAARATCAASPLDAGTVPPPTGDAAAAIDAIDAWLALADATFARSDATEGRRRQAWAWRQALAD